VSTSAWPRPGTVVSMLEYRSYPAAKAEPRVGSVPFEDSSLTWSAGTASAAILGAVVPLGVCDGGAAMGAASGVGVAVRAASAAPEKGQRAFEMY
jgi:hypothetical protein